MIYPSKFYFSDRQIEWINSKIGNVLKQGFGLTQGEYTLDFESKTAKYVKTDHAVATSSCTSALIMSLKFFNISGKDVIVPTNTFIATANAVKLAGGNPVFCDIDSDSLCASLESIKKRYTKDTKGVILVHFGGLICPDVFEIKEWCKEKGLFLIEDAAQAIGANANGISAGSIGDVGCFSFFQTKTLATGEGGMITTNNPKLYSFVKQYQDHGRKQSTDKDVVDYFTMVGNNYRLSELTAILGLAQLSEIDELISLRNKVADFYNEHLPAISKITLLNLPPKGYRHAYFKYMVLLDKGLDRVNIQEKMKAKGVLVNWSYYYPCHMQPTYKSALRLPVSEDILKMNLSIPLYPQLANNRDDLNLVLQSLKEVLDEC
jgi:dTDP-4-amino-4,6-dideoxygalactose transaminase